MAPDLLDIADYAEMPDEAVALPAPKEGEKTTGEVKQAA